MWPATALSSTCRPARPARSPDRPASCGSPAWLLAPRPCSVAGLVCSRRRTSLVATQPANASVWMGTSQTHPRCIRRVPWTDPWWVDTHTHTYARTYRGLALNRCIGIAAVIVGSTRQDTSSAKATPMVFLCRVMCISVCVCVCVCVCVSQQAIVIPPIRTLPDDEVSAREDAIGAWVQAAQDQGTRWCLGPVSVPCIN